jgi:hypothetical protein
MSFLLGQALLLEHVVVMNHARVVDLAATAPEAHSQVAQAVGLALQALVALLVLLLYLLGSLLFLVLLTFLCVFQKRMSVHMIHEGWRGGGELCHTHTLFERALGANKTRCEAYGYESRMLAYILYLWL